MIFSLSDLEVSCPANAIFQATFCEAKCKRRPDIQWDLVGSVTACDGAAGVKSDVTSITSSKVDAGLFRKIAEFNYRHRGRYAAKEMRLGKDLIGLRRGKGKKD